MSLNECDDAKRPAAGTALAVLAAATLGLLSPFFLRAEAAGPAVAPLRQQPL